MRSGAHVRQNDRQKEEPVEKTKKNNAEEQDDGIFKILTALGKNDPAKCIRGDKEILKDNLIVGLAFLHSLSAEEGHSKFRSMKVDSLTHEIIKKFESICKICKEGVKDTPSNNLFDTVFVKEAENHLFRVAADQCLSTMSKRKFLYECINHDIMWPKFFGLFQTFWTNRGTKMFIY